jgi:hypothetical protein
MTTLLNANLPRFTVRLRTQCNHVMSGLGYTMFHQSENAPCVPE